MQNLEQIILRYRDRRFVVIEPGGNHGDRLIYKGMRKKFCQLNINHEIFPYYESIKVPLLSKLYFGLWCRFLKIIFFVFKLNNGWNKPITKIDHWVYQRILHPYVLRVNPTDVIFIHGGGNMNDLWHGIRILKNVINNYPDNVIIVGPQTYWFDQTCFYSIFSKTKQKIFLFCREKYSYKLLNSLKLPKNVRILLSPDTSLYLSKEDFHTRSCGYNLVCFRTDKESTLLPKEKDIQFIFEESSYKQKLKNSLLIKDLSTSGSFKDFVSSIEGADCVYTDRLHVAILSAILGKNTVLFPNCYYKNKGVFEYSLSNFSNVVFCPFPPSPDNLKETVLRH